MDQSWLLVTCGLPFSGKSTLSREIALLTGMVRVSVDDLIPDLEYANAAVVPPESWLDAYLKAFRETEVHLEKRKSVVFDSVGHTRKNRYRLRRLADRHRASFLILHLDVSRRQAIERLLSNQNAPTRPDVPIEGFNEIANDFESPGTDELVVRYEPDCSTESWISDVLIPRLNGA